MKTFFLLIAILACGVAKSQNTLIGKWQPVYFSLDKIIVADIKEDTVFISDTVNVMFKEDADPEASKELMKLMGQIMLEKMKNVQQEFKSAGEYLEISTTKNTTKKGKYNFVESTQSLTIELDGKINKYFVSYKNGRLLLTGQLESRKGKKGSMVIEYEKI